MSNDFDVASLEYDTNFTFSNIGRAQRHFVYEHLKSILKSNTKLSILEINCGTGEDALYFAKQGHNVTATDISQGMIQVANSKSAPKNLIFKTLDINTITQTTFTKKFDIVFSNFGGLNCLSKNKLQYFLNTLPTLLKPNGKIIMVVMPKHCLWERIYFSLKGNFKKAKRRNTNNSLLVNVDGTSIETWYYNPEDVLDLTEKIFIQKTIKPIGIAIPPSYLECSFLAKKPFLNLLKSTEHILRQPFWAKYADHFLIELEKK